MTRIFTPTRKSNRHRRHNGQTPIVPPAAPIAEQDLVRYGEVMLDPHDIVAGSSPNTVRYVRRYPDGTIYAAIIFAVPLKPHHHRTREHQEHGGDSDRGDGFL